MKLVIADTKTGKCYQTEMDKSKDSLFIGKKIGEKIDGGVLGASGYSFEIRGGSDSSGFPMRRDVRGPRKAAILLSSGSGYRPKMKGIRRKKTVRGNTISAEIVQVNLKTVEYGSAKLEELFPQTKKEEKK